MNGWRSRLLVGLVMLLAMRLHAVALADIPNTPAGMLLYHGSAATVDFILLFSAPWLLSGRLCDDVQALNLASIIANFAGWIAYLAYAPPVFYDTFMQGLTYVQFIRLFILDRHGADRLGLDLVRGAGGVWRAAHS